MTETLNESKDPPQKLCCTCGSILRVPIGDLPVHRRVVEKWRQIHDPARSGEGHAPCSEEEARQVAGERGGSGRKSIRLMQEIRRRPGGMLRVESSAGRRAEGLPRQASLSPPKQAARGGAA